MLSKEEITLILEALSAKYGHGYSSVVEVGRLQAKLSGMLELANKREQVKFQGDGNSAIVNDNKPFGVKENYKM